jgi:Xaa-Pro aminopeptidase
LSTQLSLEKTEQAIRILDELDIDLWLIFAREISSMRDPSLDLLLDINCTWQSAFLINRNGDTAAIIGSLDLGGMQNQLAFKNLIPYVKSIKEPLSDYLNKYSPAKIALNYSLNSHIADGLTHGMFLTLAKLLEGTPYPERFISSESILSALKGRKSKTELALMKKAVEETLLIFDEVTCFIAPGVTEKEIGAFITGLVKERGFELAWDPAHCPAVFTGPGTAGAHTGPTDRVVEKGHLVNIDFGIKYYGYCSDLQRTWYILKDDEDFPPETVTSGFNVLKEAIRLAAKTVKAGIQGWEADLAARDFITQNGYEEFQHGLGHQVGRVVHDGGGGLFPRWERYGNTPFIPLETGQVYTIEPRLTVKNHGIVTIEEEIVVSDSGCYYLSTPQENLILIKK